MVIYFNDEQLISGFFILKIIPRCKIKDVALITTGKNEYFVDGYKYGGYNDFRVKFDRNEQSLVFSSEESSFKANKSR
jgi:hypothetical protein